jgi:hypothetical protein
MANRPATLRCSRLIPVNRHERPLAQAYMLISMPTDNSTILGVVHFIFASRRGSFGCRARETALLHRTATLLACSMQTFIWTTIHLDDDRPSSALSDFSRDPQLRLGRESSHPDRAHETNRPSDECAAFMDSVIFTKTPPTDSSSSPGSGWCRAFLPCKSEAIVL